MTPNVDSLREKYPYMRFAKQWGIDGEMQYQLGQCDAMVDAIRMAPLLPRFRQALHQMSLKKGAQATTAIEGNTLSDEDIDRVASGETLPPSQAYQQREVENILAAFNQLFTHVAQQERPELISPSLLLGFHEMIGRELGEHFRAVPGQFAQSQRVVGPYRAPAPEDVLPLIEQLCGWLQHEFHYPQQRFSESVIQSIVTHVYIEWIHPFDDGNGRTGRLVEFYILVRAGLPSIASHLLANHYNDTRQEYYRQLHKAKEDRDLTAFIKYATVGLRDGLVKALRRVQENAIEQMWRVLVYDAFGKRKIGHRESFNRQREVALSLPLDRPIQSAEIALLTPNLAAQYADSTTRTIFRDVSELAKLGLIIRGPGTISANRAQLDGSMPPQRRTPVVPA